MLELIWSKEALSILQKNQIKYGMEGIEIRNNFPYVSFSIFRMEFESKIRETIWDIFNLIWFLGTWKLRNLMEPDMWDPNYT
jgi:hypothetical protein